MTGLDNIRKVYSAADELDRCEGELAYTRYSILMMRFAAHYGCAFNNTVAAFVSLSPNNSWYNNLRSLATLLHGIANRVPRTAIITSTYNACLDRAFDYATGMKDFGMSTKGPKVRAFYQNIMCPEDPKPVTVDGHMMSIWSGRQMTMVEAARSKIAYSEVSAAIRRVAAQEKLLPNQMQAILWFTWKRINRIVYDGQLNLFRYDDQWGILHLPEDVPIFTRKEVKNSGFVSEKTVEKPIETPQLFN